MTFSSPTEKTIVIFDGECGFCSRFTQFFAKYDTHQHLLWVSQTSPFGKELLSQYGLESQALESIIVLTKQSYFTKGKAVRELFSHLPRFKVFAIILRYCPLFLLDKIYQVIAQNRNKIYSKTKCQRLNSEH